MNWGAIHSQIIKKYPFWNKLSISSSDAPEDHSENLPPFLQSFSFQIQQALESSKSASRICYIMPSTNHCASWITFMLGLQVVKKHFDPSLAEKHEFRKGQYCLYKNKHIVQILAIDHEHMKLKLNPTLKYGRKNQSHLEKNLRRQPLIYFQPIHDKHPLAQWGDFHADFHSRSDSTIDEILGIVSYGNTLCYNAKLFLCATKSHIYNDLKEYNINDSPLTELLDWQYIGSYHKESIGSKITKLSGPTIYLSSKLPNVRALLENDSHAIKLAIIDSATRVSQEPMICDELLANDISVICLSDPSEEDYMEYLEERNFQFLTPNYESLRRQGISSQIPFFKHYHQTIVSHSCKSYEIIHCNNANVEEIADRYNILRKSINLFDRHHPARNICKRISSAIRRLSQIYSPPTLDNLEQIRHNLHEAQDLLKRNGLQISGELEQLTIKIITDIENMASNGKLLSAGSKFDLFQNRLAIAGNSNICVLSMAPTELMNSYWRSIKNTHSFATYDEFKERLEDSSEELWILGFNSKKILCELILSANSKVTLFFYPFEEKYFNSSVKNWWDKYFGLETTQIQNNQPAKSAKSRIPTEKRTSSSPATTPVRRHKPARTLSKELKNLALLKISFSGNYQIVCSATHKLNTVTDEITTLDFSTIPRYVPSQLQTGDYILFRTTGTDIIREWVDKELSHTGQIELRHSAESWKRPLLEYFEKKQRQGLNRSDIYRIFESKGLKRTYTAFASWLDPERIGPLYEEDLELIMTLTNRNQADLDINTIKNSIHIIRAKHKKAWRSIQQVLAEELVPQLQTDGNSDTGMLGPFVLPRVGEIIILRIDKIEEYAEALSNSQLNRLRQDIQIEIDETVFDMSVLNRLFTLEEKLLHKIESSL